MRIKKKALWAFNEKFIFHFSCLLGIMSARKKSIDTRTFVCYNINQLKVGDAIHDYK